jgi:hypothetical protein
MRWLRLIMLGLASVYPLYWTAQFALFFVPESLVGFWLGNPVQVVSLSYLQAMAVVQPRAIFPALWEGLIFALFFSALIVGLRGDRFLTGALAIVVLGQSALLPFLSLAIGSPTVSSTVGFGGALAFVLMVIGLYRILRCTGGFDFLDRLALLSLLAILPQATLWLTFKFAYPFFDVRFLLLRLVPLYLAALIAAALPAKFSEPGFNGVPWTEIFASSAAAGLLILAIGLSSYSLKLASSSFHDRPLQLASRVSIASPSEPPVVGQFNKRAAIWGSRFI